MAQERNSRPSSCEVAYRRMNERASIGNSKLSSVYWRSSIDSYQLSGLFPWVKVTKCSGPAEWRRCRHSVIPGSTRGYP
jgi:hypothetical protein